MTAIESGEACIANIGFKERRKRMRFGVAVLVACAVIAVLLVGIGAQRLWRIGLFLPFWAGALGVFQAREKT